MLTTSKRSSYVCWRCVSRGSQHVSTACSRLAYTTTASLRNATTEHVSSNDSSKPVVAAPSRSKPRRVTIHDRLRTWAEENKDTMPKREGIGEARPATSVGNTDARTVSSGKDAFDLEPAADAWSSSVMGSGADVDFGIVGTSSRNPGDLIEIKSSNSRIRQLAVYIGFFNGMHHFYTNFAKWIMAKGFPASFSVSNFATFEELEPVFKAIPEGLTTEEYEDMQRDNKGPSRGDGAALLNKMQSFKLEADRVWLNNMDALEGIAKNLSDLQVHTHMSLFQIASQTIPKAVRADGTMAPSALYAVLQRIEMEHLTFHPVSDSDQCQRRDYLFEIFPKRITNSFLALSNLLREVTAIDWNPDAKPSKGYQAWQAFLTKAREAVERSRKVRQRTQHGVLQPSSGLTLEQPPWTSLEWRTIQLLEHWAVHNVIAPNSHLHATGSAILRQLGLYPDVDLDRSAAWLFLQEIGVVDPWEIPGRHQTRLPETSILKGRGIKRSKILPSSLKESMRNDVAATARQGTDETVFCIDKAETTLIDDGISLERTENDEEYWIHVHAADPGAEIHPRSRLDEHFEKIPDNIYLSGHFASMLPDFKEAPEADLAGQFSLEEGKTALTFSAKVNFSGDILDYKIEPRRVTKVTNLDPTDVAKFCNQRPPPPVPSTKLLVGQLVNELPVFARDLPRVNDLSEGDKDDLKILHRLSEALKKRRLQHGAWPSFPPRPVVNVRFNQGDAIETRGEEVKDSQEAAKQLRKAAAEEEDTEELEEQGARLREIPADPQIEISYEDTAGNNMVANTMVLAGQIATMWCAERGIPAPFRKNPHAKRNWDDAQAFVNKEMIPAIQEGKPIDPAKMRTLNAMIGAADLSTEAGPYLLLGLPEGYMKVTSPLRRYADLIAHWQIHSALAYERQVGRKIDPKLDNLNEILPWGKEALTEKLQLVEMREKMVRKIAMCNNEWILIALARALSFEGGLPKSVTLTVSQSYSGGVLGRLDYFDVFATMPALEMNDMALIKDLRVDDQFEVEIIDVNVLERQVKVRAIKYLGRGSSGPAPVSNSRGSILGMMSKQFGPAHFPKAAAQAKAALEEKPQEV